MTKLNFLRSTKGWISKLQGVLDRGTCQMVLNVAASNASIGLATHMWNTMKTVYRYPATTEAYGAMIHAFGEASLKHDSPEDADYSMLAALLELEEQGAGQASIGLQRLVASYLSTSPERTDSAFFLLCDFHEEWLQGKKSDDLNDSTKDAPAPSSSDRCEQVRKVYVSALNAIIRACALQNSIGRAFSTFEEIRTTFGLEPDLGSYNALLEACSQRQTPEGLTAFALLEDIKKTKGLEPDAESYHLTLLALVRSGLRMQASFHG